MKRSILLLTSCLVATLWGCSAPVRAPLEGEAGVSGNLRQHPYDGGTLQTDTRGRACSITLNGDINHNTVRRLGTLLQEVENADCRSKRFILNARDGVLGDAVTLGAMLRNRHYDTEVMRGTTCNTPCLLVFAAGQERVLPESNPPTRLAFTQIPPDQDFGKGVCQTELNRGQQLTLTRYLRAMLPASTATAAYQKIVAADCQRTDYYGPANALAMGLATSTH